ncbi:NshR/TsnR family 23S rRNA methyltransferase [Micrococcus luteus]|uniref:TrmH family RNA methyltransferase n=1 Tax=Micrococcus luteus TaxID=1270 RepID=UPI001910FAA5|nr:TrmH family RNA methyltransferase [Micrococcus luteus]QQE48059.1 NshR/TsnR family 23S rRNA methyltransferase [Micrococcus luteus]UTX35574.1 NshR/TsnR family 23S rRNA methyltransferase [Micrococcus luteus]
MAVPTREGRVRSSRPIEHGNDPVLRRVADVLRAGSAARRTFLIDDEQNIVQAGRHRVALDSLYVAEGFEPSEALLHVADQHQIPTYAVSGHALKEIFGSEKRARAFALARGGKVASLDDLAKRVGDILILDGVRIPGNIGAIIRTACALEAAGVVLLDSGLASVTDRRIIRASRGTVFAVPVVLSTRARMQEFLNKQGMRLATLSADAPHSVYELKSIEERVALLMGSERGGPSAEMAELSTLHLSIPMSDDVESLNVSVAAAIALHEHRG